MDRQTRHELNRLIDVFGGALDAVRSADDEEDEMAAWRQVQAASWELKALIPNP